MKKYSNTKKFLLWVSIILLVLFVLLVAWRGLRRGSEMRPDTIPPQRTEKRTPPVQAPGTEQPETTTPDREPTDLTETSLEELSAQPMFGWPASPYRILELLEFKKFALAYDEQHEQAAWVAYRLAAQQKGIKHERYDRFMADSRVSTGSADPDDYANSGYDRGHLAPAADFATDKEAMKESFYMSNMSPQAPAFNRGIWSKLENQVRDWAETAQEIWVVTGPVLISQQELEKIGANGVTVPPYYYKVVLDVIAPTHKMIGFVLPNAGSSQELSKFIVPVDSIESLTGLDFFPLLPDELEEALESNDGAVEWIQ